MKNIVKVLYILIPLIILTILLLVLAAMTLASCQNSKVSTKQKVVVNSDADLKITFFNGGYGEDWINNLAKRFEEANGADQPLLPMFDNESELDFAKQLLTAALDHHEEYEQMIDGHLKNWDASRIAYMDRIILEAALAEMINFPEIALEVSFNEYIELAKEYSSEKSHVFINGILNEILTELKRENKLLKAVNLKD